MTDIVEKKLDGPTKSIVLAKQAAVLLMQENAELIEQAEALETSFTFPLGEHHRVKVTLGIEIEELAADNG